MIRRRLAGLDDDRRYAGLALLVAIVALAALLARAGGFGWVTVYQPHGLRLVHGHTVEYESAYFGPVVHGMLGGPAPEVFTTAHYRMWLAELVAAALLRWTGSEFWALAGTDLLGACLGAVGVVWLGRVLRLGPAPTGLGALLYALSPVLVGFMWRNQLHVQAVGSMALGSAASLAVLLREPATSGLGLSAHVRAYLPRAVALGLVWLTSSLQYQFHLVLVPALLGVVVAERSQRWTRLAVWCGGAIVLVSLTAALAAALAAAGLPLIAENNDPRNALQDFAASLGRTDAPGALAQLARPLERIALTYHPMMTALALAGLWVLPRRAAIFWLAILALSNAFLLVRDFDRVAHALSPAIYLSAAASVAYLPDRVAGIVNRVANRPLVGPLGRRLVLGALLTAALLVTAHTNADLWGDYRMFHAEPGTPLFPR